MKALVQRVSEACVIVDEQCVGKIDYGMLAYIGIGKDDSLATAKKLVDKLLTYRIFANDAGKLDKNVQQAGGGLLLVSQFTLMAKTDKGRRPDFGEAMPPDDAKVLFQQLVEYAQSQYQPIATGIFGAHMLVQANNDGPLNFILEVE